MEKQLEHGNMVCSSFCEFKLSLPETQTQDVGMLVSNKPIFTDVHHQLWPWVVMCLPRGREEDEGEYVSLFVGFADNNGRACSASSSGAEAPGGENKYSTGAVPFLLQAFVVGADTDATPPSRPRAPKPMFVRYTYGRTDDKINWWKRFVKRSDLESLHAANGVVTIVCGVLVFPDNDSVTIPPSTMAKYFRRMLDCGDGTDVSFLVGGETFTAHRAVLAARSPVFRAELFGSMEDANLPCITLHDIDPAVFSILLRYVYADALPPPPTTDDEEADLDATTDLFRHVLAAADRYALDRLKLMCAQRLCDVLSVDTVAGTIACAEMHGCPELKKRCLDLFMEENFNKAVVTEGCFQLMQRFPSVLSLRQICVYVLVTV